ncbi:MAG: hypothetical protein DWQ36_03500 [Acidobacteria bacterium]|nr:MAG: hypothetical protein DWQ30_13590 [Acidobacteriota bacterium]REK10684.1 MAG: hypothetical protein DWQ36_03500 [Acidobacteriota bacterium]
MRPVHLLLADEGIGDVELEALLGALAAAGLRVGLLALDRQSELPVPPRLQLAARSGALRGVQLHQSGSLVLKPRRGPAPLADLVREHFLGCAAVLVVGTGGAPAELIGELQPRGRVLRAVSLRRVAEDRWGLRPPRRPADDRGGVEVSGTELAARLRRPYLLADDADGGD